MSRNGRLSKVQIEVVNDYLDLLQNQYMQIFASIHPEWWFIKLRHLVNGRTLILEWQGESATLREGKNVLKRYGRAKTVC